MIEKQIEKLALESLDLLVIENVGNLVCPASFDLGEDMRMVILSIAEGDDKPLKYPVAFLNADVAVITKIDLAPYIDADVAAMRRNIGEINPKVAVFEAGMKNGVYSADEVTAYILGQAEKKQQQR